MCVCVCGGGGGGGREREREREVTTASDEDPKPKLIVPIRFCTAKSDIPQYKRFVFFLSHAHIFKLTKRSILNTIWSDLDPNRVCKCRERERDWCRHVKVYIASAD